MIWTPGGKVPRILTFTSGPEDWRERADTRQMFRQVLVSLRHNYRLVLQLAPCLAHQTNPLYPAGASIWAGMDEHSLWRICGLLSACSKNLLRAGSGDDSDVINNLP